MIICILMLTIAEEPQKCGVDIAEYVSNKTLCCAHVHMSIFIIRTYFQTLKESHIMCCNNVVLMWTGLQDCVQRRPAHPRHQPGVLGAGGAGRHLQVVLQDPSDRYRVVSRALI